MSTHSDVPTTRVAPATLRRPGTLVTAIITAFIAGAAAVANGVVILTGGQDLIKQAILSAAGLPEGSLSDKDFKLIEELSGKSLASVQSTFELRAYLVLACGALLLLFGLLMRKAAVWARILVTLSGTLVLLFSAVIVADGTIPVMAGLSMAAILGGIVTIVTTWLPANRRYAKALR